MMIQEAVKAYGVRGLAEKLGVTPAYVSMLANGKRTVTEGVLTRLGSLVNNQKASLGRLELPTHCLEGSCSIQLSYRDKCLATEVYHKLF